MNECNESEFEELINNIFNENDFNEYISDNLKNKNKNKSNKHRHKRKMDCENNTIFKEDILFNPNYEINQGILINHDLYGVILINPKYFNIYPSYDCSIENRKIINKKSCLSYGNIRVEQIKKKID